MTYGRKILTLSAVTIALVLALLQLISLIWINVKFKGIFEHSVKVNKYKLPPVIDQQQEQNMSVVYNEIWKITECYDRPFQSTIQQHGAYWIFHNFVKAEKEHRCFESVTYTTQGDYTFLDNLIPVVERWKGPVSVALHAPGTDFQPTLLSIAYLRNCKSSLFKKYVTFHVFFDLGHLPTTPTGKPFATPIGQLYKDTYNCSKGAPYANVGHKMLYKTIANISYPINVARNVARESAQTHFVLASDIELYPSLDVIEQFLRMVVRRRDLFETKDPMVFVLPVFEVLGGETAPENKTALKKMFQNQKAFSFHRKICNHCHAIPHLKQWLNLNVSQRLDVFTIAKRQGSQDRWEAFYIGTHDEPLFDERLDWERHGNKMAQAYALCLLDYNYMVLDNAFLVHKPGIKARMINAEEIPKTAKYISKHLGVELDVLYGKRKGCKA